MSFFKLSKVGGTFSFFLLCVIALVSPEADCANAQMIAAQFPAETPSIFPAFDFDDAVLVKFYQNRNGINVLGVISFQEGEKGKSVDLSLLKSRVETRQRLVKDEEGNDINQTYSVRVPYIETVTEVRKDVIEKRYEIPVDKVSVKQINGAPITIDQFSQTFKTAKRCFRHSETDEKRFLADPFFAEMFSENVFVVSFDQEDATEVAPIRKAKQAP